MLIAEILPQNDDKTDTVFRAPMGRFFKAVDDLRPLQLSGCAAA